MDLPAEYVAYMRSEKLKYGFTDLESYGSYFKLEPLNSIEQFNTDIQTHLYAPGFTAFASSGGGDFYAFDQTGAVFALPLIGMGPEYAIRIADSWNEYEKHILPPEDSASAKQVDVGELHGKLISDLIKERSQSHPPDENQ